MKKILLIACSLIFAIPVTWAANFVSLEDGDIISGVRDIEIVTLPPDNIFTMTFTRQYIWPDEAGGGGAYPEQTKLPTELNQVYTLDTTKLRNGLHHLTICSARLLSDGSTSTSCDRAGVTVDNPDTIAPQMMQLDPGPLVRPDEFIMGSYRLRLNAKDESGIQLVRFMRDDGELIQTVTLPAETNINLYEVDWDTTTINNGLHHIYAEAVDNNGNVASTKEGTLFLVKDIVPVPPRYIENRYTPTNVYARSKNYSVNVVWQGSEQEERYAVYRRLDSESSFTRVAEVEYLVYVDQLPVDTRYAEYYVSAVYRYGESEPSDIFTVAPTFRTR